MSTAAPASPALLLELTQIGKHFGQTVANSGIDLQLRRGEVVALLGENGAGKTTLMSILFGHYIADEGHIQVADAHGTLKPLPPGNPQAALAARIGMVHQHFSLAENLTGFENILLGSERLWLPARQRAARRAKIESIMRESRLHVALDERVGNLSVGERQRIEILKALAHDTQILVLDEPTAVLTPQEADGLYQTVALLAAHGLGVIFISHKLHEVLAASHRIVVLRRGRLAGTLRTQDATREQIAELMVGREVASPERPELAPGPVRLQLHDINLDSPQPRRRLTQVNLKVHASEIVGVAGVSGNGQAGLSDLLSGLVAPSSGQLSIGGASVRCSSAHDMMRHKVARIPEDRHHQGVVADMNISENLIIEALRDTRFARAGFLRRRAARAHAKKLIDAYDIRCEGPDAIVRLLSGGNMQKLILARALDPDPQVILANQPTRGLDIGAQQDVYQRLLQARQRGAAIVLISEDLDELFTLSDRIVVLHGGQLTEAGPTQDTDRRSVGLLMAGQSPVQNLRADHA